MAALAKEQSPWVDVASITFLEIKGQRPSVNPSVTESEWVVNE